MKWYKKPAAALIQHFANVTMGTTQKMTHAAGERTVFPGMPEAVRLAAADGCVLLKNNGVLPFRKDQKIAVFGRCQYDWFFVGYGSGGDVHAPYTVNLMEALESRGAAVDPEVRETYESWRSKAVNTAVHGVWGHWPFSHPEMPLSEEAVSSAASRCDTAVIVIGRAAGEDRENELEPGSYYLTEEELRMIGLVTAAFKETVILLNAGNIIDMSWVKRFGDRISALMLVWLGGMESGNAVCDLLYGDVSPSGRLPDTIAEHYEDYPSSASFGGKDFNDYAEGIYVGYRYFDLHPEKVLWPFGFGLSYTAFSLEFLGLETGSGVCRSHTLRVRVTNTGNAPGKETAMLFARQPRGRIEKAQRVLVSFAKTELLKPGESEILALSFTDRDLCSYDTQANAFLLEPGEYILELNGKDVCSITETEETVIETVHEICSREVDLRARILENMPQEIPQKNGNTPHFEDVLNGNVQPDDFIAGLSDRDLEALTRGHGMMGSKLGPAGNAGVFGGIIPSLREKGLKPVVCCDGPAGIRLRAYCTLLPCGTAFAATWDVKLVEKLHTLLGNEMTVHQADVHLAPGMNIHRNPLCGRNFEYFSEDPVLSGRIAASCVKGVQQTGHISCPKHFACNNQETHRNRHDSRVPEAALREIYLRNFEIMVKESHPLTIMTSYNKLNGIWNHYNYDLVTTLLRMEWGFDGLVLTDWWMRPGRSPEFPKLKDNAYRIRAQVDVLMPGDRLHMAKRYRSDGTLLPTLGKPDGITRAELQRTAKNVLTLMLRYEYNRKPTEET